MGINSKSYIDENGRVCTRCLSYLPWSEFNKNCLSKTSYTAHCKHCSKQQYAENGSPNKTKRVVYPDSSAEREQTLTISRRRNAELNSQETQRIESCEYFRNDPTAEIVETYGNAKNGIFAKYFTK